MKNIPWVEKYRPHEFEKIVLDKYNKQILENIVNKNYFPNLLFYGPPGTGKTTTIINLIKIYQKKHNQEYKELVIHLNASDERGIEIIRTQIQCFVNCKNLFRKGKKFVILDEIDYMTKNAQQALKFLIQEYSEEVSFCLICNYISKIEMELQNDFVKLRYNELPSQCVINFLKNIIKLETLNVEEENIKIIQSLFKSDIRSMINFIQNNHNTLITKIKNIENIFEDIFESIVVNKKYSIEKNAEYIEGLCIEFDIELSAFIKKFFKFIIHNKLECINNKKYLFDNTGFICHNLTNNIHYVLNYMCSFLKNLKMKQ